MKNHLVIGGAGFIGCNLAAHLLKKGKNVTVFDNLSRKGALNNIRWLVKNNSNSLDIIQGDICTDNYKLLEAVKKTEVIYHLASQVAVTTSLINPREDFEINALGTLNVLEAIRGAGNNPVAIYSSTNKVYGKLEDVKVKELDKRYEYRDKIGISEEQSLDFNSPYGCSKGAADQYFRDYARIYGLRTVVMRQSCLAADCEVITPFGKKPIAELHPGDIVHSGEGWTKVKRVFKTGFKPVRRLSTMNGLSVTLTEDHRVFRPHGLYSNCNFAYGDFLAVLPEARFMPRWEPIPDKVLEKECYLDAIRARTSDVRCLNKAERIASSLLPLQGDRLLAIAEIVGRLFGDGHLGIHQRQSRKKPAYTVQHFGSESELIEVSQRLIWLGLPTSGIIRCAATSTLPDEHVIQGHSRRIQQQSIPIFTLFESLGVPVGDKVRVDYELPTWVVEGHRLVKRAFLRGFLGAELTKVNPNSYLAPSFSQSKDVTHRENGMRWIQQLRDLLAEFDIKTSCFEAEPVEYKRGTTTQTTVRLLGGREMFEKLAKIGYAFSAERSSRLNALLRWQSEYTSADRFEIVEGLYHADGQLFWDSLAKIEPLGEQAVYDIEVEAETHLFVAGGIQVSNCIYGTHQFGVEDQGWVAYFTIQNELKRPITIYGDGKQVRDVLFVSDLIRAFESATQKIDVAQGQIYNIGGGLENTLSLLELIDLLKNITGKKMQYNFSAWRPGDQLVYISDIRKAKKELDWEPIISIPEGLKILHAWVKENKEILLHHLENRHLAEQDDFLYNARFKEVEYLMGKNFPIAH